MTLASSNAVLEEEHPTDLAFNSPSIGILSQRFPRPGKCQVLDLGAPASSTVAFFSESACKFYLEDLYRFFIAPRKDREDDGDEDKDSRTRKGYGCGFEIVHGLLVIVHVPVEPSGSAPCFRWVEIEEVNLIPPRLRLSWRNHPYFAIPLTF